MQKVRQRAHYDRYYEDDEVVEEILTSVSTFDESGNLVEAKVYSPEGEVVEIETHVYENGKEIRSSQENLVHEATQRTEFTYDGDKLSVQRDYFTDEDYIETRYTYDSQNRITEIRKTDNDDASHGLTTFEYTEDMTIEKEYDEDDILVRSHTYRRDDAGNMVENTRSEMIGKDALVTREEITYKDKDNIALVERYRGDTLIFHAENFFDDQGHRTGTRIRDLLNPKESEFAFEYDDSDHVSKEQYFENGNMLRERTFVYDAHGELIEETVYQWLYDDYYQPSGQRVEVEYY